MEPLTNFEGKPILSDDEMKAEFAALFPNGWAGPDVMAELAPDGWAAGPLVAVFHPSAEQVYEETVQIHRNMANFPGRKPDAPPPPEPTFEEIEAEHEYGEVEPARECQELVGWCLWDVFSDNHEVFADDGRLFDLGSSRGSAGFLAEVVNGQGGPPPPPRPELPAEFQKMFDPPPGSSPEVLAAMAEMRKEMVGDGGYTYLDFYMGAGRVSDRADLVPVYALIFRRLRARGMDWVYHFPRLSLVDFRPLKKQMDEQKRREEGGSEFEGYDPSAAFEEDEAEREKDAEIAEMREKLDEGHREAVAAARDEEPPAVVRAYQQVYGEFPEGWPPEA